MSVQQQQYPKVLAVASAGGHWVQLMRLRSAWQGCSVAYLTTEPSYAAEVFSEDEEGRAKSVRFYTTLSANRWQKLRLLRQLFDVVWVLFKERPDVVCTTGAAPGYFAIRLGKFFGARTVWIDSIANAETMSLAGIKAASCADVWLTQWEALTMSQNHSGRSPEYWGAVL